MIPKGTAHRELLTQAITTPAGSELGAVINARTAYCDATSSTATHRARARNHQPIPMPRRREATTAPTVANPGTITSSGPIPSGPWSTARLSSSKTTLASASTIAELHNSNASVRAAREPAVCSSMPVV